ncbi:lysozyme inhibitor LprI family protein [Rhizobium alvei]|uniref:Lysozyme inhibitor LprI family protein n=1 Tax=Rhizobium alvei TaxID=1132659 RepID=A0ABT8YHK4_9HYPH|nr:lysozyme inhibitor LprI family protein [Rhizobium alvei]MDO6963163.1 lysozyme inhibitor LprI family protein [Rhizobium alvei]
MAMFRRSLLLAGMLVAAAGPALADEGDNGLLPFPVSQAFFSDHYRDCSEAGLSNADMNACRDAELSAWDKRLNVAYKRLMTADKLDKAAKERLKTAQKAWIADRDLSCELPYIASGEGTMGLGWSAHCTVKETALRAERLEAWVQSLGL